MDEFEEVRPGEHIPDEVAMGAVELGTKGRTATFASRAEAVRCDGDLHRSLSSCWI